MIEALLGGSNRGQALTTLVPVSSRSANASNGDGSGQSFLHLEVTQ